MNTTVTILLVVLATLTTGCQHKLPPNTYLKDVKSEIRGPGWSSTLSAKEAATGTAAIEASKDFHVVEAPPAKKK